MPVSAPFRNRIAAGLERLYGDRGRGVLPKFDKLADRYATLRGTPDTCLWNERSAVLITYGDQVTASGRRPLAVLHDFLHEHALDQVISALHILPFFPYSSDDGFSVIDYRNVDPRLGEWMDIGRLGQSFGLMFDFVVNHCSRQSQWFQHFLRDEPPYHQYFIAVEPDADLSAVTRPRSTPLATPFETSQGVRHVWTTFSSDQIDLNFSNPDVLLEMLDVLLFYVERGAKAIRLDAVGFLWKSAGTCCMHLPQTHAVVKIMRALLDDLAPGTILLTETNVPHAENVSYFGAGDEAHAVYQFSLAPLLLDALLTGDAGPLNQWLLRLEPPRAGTTFFNLTASHDGIGLRPLEGLLAPDRISSLIHCVQQRGGLMSTRRGPDGTDLPYELNVSYFSALGSPEGLPAARHARRFLTSQGVMLALRGLPGIYFHSLVGTPNHTDGVKHTGQNRTINRRRFDLRELRGILSAESSAQRKVFDGYRQMLAVRIAQPAFHPDAAQTVIDTGHKSVIAFERTSQAHDQRIVVLANVASEAVRVDSSHFCRPAVTSDLLSRRQISRKHIELEPYGLAWLV
jgi:sucrose phosphorylase